MKRRDFIKTGLITAPLGMSWVFSLASHASVTNLAREPDREAARATFTRPEVSSPEATRHLKSFARAVSVMQRAAPVVNGVENGLSWTTQARVHLNHCRHGRWGFFPWHREYLLRFEAIIRTVSGDPEFCMPYWDWTRNPDMPLAFRDRESPLCYRSGGAVDPSRIYDISGRIYGVTGPQVTDSILRSSSFQAVMGSFNASGQFEYGPHNGVHGVIGSYGGPMNTYLSPLDPVFWVHHSNVDRLWALWQEYYPQWRSVPSVQARYPSWLNERLEGFFGANGVPLPVLRTSQDLLDLESLGVSYPELTRRTSKSDSPPAQYRSLASTGDEILPEVVFMNDRARVEITLPQFAKQPDLENYLNGFISSPVEFAKFTFVLTVSHFPNIPAGGIMKISFLGSDDPEQETEPVFLGNYSFFLTSGHDHSGGNHDGSHVINFIPDFNFDYSLLLERLNAKGLKRYPEVTRFSLEFSSPRTGLPLQVESPDFSQLRFKLNIEGPAEG